MNDIYIVKIEECGRKKRDTEVLRKKIYTLVKNTFSEYGYCGEFVRGETGKPYMADCPLMFNISHTGGAATAAVSDCDVGIDIEKIRSVNLKISDKFSADEKKFINSSENPEKAFFEIWTAKEAYLKKEGIGLTVPLDSFSIIGRKDIFRYYYEDYVISVCCRKVLRFCGLRQDEG